MDLDQHICDIERRGRRRTRSIDLLLRDYYKRIISWMSTKGFNKELKEPLIPKEEVEMKEMKPKEKPKA